MTTKQTQFRANFAAQQIDDTGLVPGVSVITIGPANQFFVDRKSLESVVAAANAQPGGVKSKFNHSWGVEAICGYLKNFRIDGEQVRADWQLLPAHPAYTFLRSLIATQPSTFGLSISFKFTSEIDEKSKQEFIRVTELFSVDVVDVPAANPSGLFSEPTGTFEDVCRALHASGLSKTEAIFRAVADVPILYADYRQRGGAIFNEAPPVNGTFGELLEHYTSAGQSKAEALQTIVRRHPETYNQWRVGDTSKL